MSFLPNLCHKYRSLCFDGHFPQLFQKSDLLPSHRQPLSPWPWSQTSQLSRVNYCNTLFTGTLGRSLQKHQCGLYNAASWKWKTLSNHTLLCSSWLPVPFIWLFSAATALQQPACLTAHSFNPSNLTSVYMCHQGVYTNPACIFSYLTNWNFIFNNSTLLS